MTIESNNPMDNSLTLDEAARDLGLSAATLRMQIRFHTLNAHKEGGVWRVSRAAVEDYRQHHLGRKGWARRAEGGQAAG